MAQHHDHHNGIMLITSGCANGLDKLITILIAFDDGHLSTGRQAGRTAEREEYRASTAALTDPVCQQLNYLHVPPSHLIALRDVQFNSETTTECSSTPT